MKQTAVELLEKRITNTSITSNGQMIFYHEELKRWLDEAKAMEKEKMIDFAKYCLNNVKYLNFEKALFNVEEYYVIFKQERNG